MTFPMLRILFLLAALVLPVLSQAAAGRVLIAVGDVTAQRGNTVLKLDRDFVLESGDVVRTGDASNAQFRFTDGAMVALRANSQFSIDQYRFVPTDPGSAEEKGFFSLVKGGLRTISGLIGKKNRDAYSMGTPTATIGIRGTHYNLMVCQGNCRNNDGSLAKDGTYGTVYHGIINVANQNGSGNFSRDQSFFVADSQSGINRLIAPPPFLKDKLEGQGSSKKNGSAENTQQAEQQVAGNQGTPPAAPADNPAPVTNPPPVITTENKDAEGAPKVLANVASVNKGDGVYPSPTATGTFLSAEYNPTTGAHNAFNAISSATVQASASGISSISTSSYQKGTTTVVDGGADSGVIAWGRWAGGTAYLNAWGNQVLTADQGFHMVFGTTPTSSPAQNGVTFNLIGATTPTLTTNAASSESWSVTGGSLTVNFLAASFSGSLSLNLTSTAGQSAYAMSLSHSGLSVTGTNGWSGSVTHTSGTQNVCGASCGATGTLIFAGPTATHAGTTYQFVKSDSIYVQGAAAFKR